MNFIPNYKNSFRILKGGKISLVVSSFLAGTTLSFAAPSGGVVTSGDANISQAGKVTNISQSTQKASINWNKVTPNHRTMGYKDIDRYEVPYKNSFLRLEEARAELTKIRRGCIIHHLVPELCQKLPVNK